MGSCHNLTEMLPSPFLPCDDISATILVYAALALFRLVAKIILPSSS